VSTTRAFVIASRPRQWTKNLLVVAAPGAAGALGEGSVAVRTLVMVVAMCAASSATYLVNDLLDRHVDARHPTKRHRPIANGTLSVGRAGFGAGALMVLALIAAFALDVDSGVVLVAYLVLTLSYSAVWKHIAVVDLVAVAGGFVLRALAGSAAGDVEASTWFVIFVSFAALMVVTGKREAEFVELSTSGEDPTTIRTALGAYSLAYLRMVLALAAGAALVVYCLWAFESGASSTSTVPWFEVSIVPMVAAVLRYLLVLDQGRGAAPEEIFLQDRVLQSVGAVWAVVFLAGVYQ
jgi:decaprenyl-phosphate phosphoribosyltransferase